MFLFILFALSTPQPLNAGENSESIFYKYLFMHSNFVWYGITVVYILHVFLHTSWAYLSEDL
jgi:hypothetical protein